MHTVHGVLYVTHFCHVNFVLGSVNVSHLLVILMCNADS